MLIRVCVFLLLASAAGAQVGDNPMCQTPTCREHRIREGAREVIAEERRRAEREARWERRLREIRRRPVDPS